MKEWIGIPGRAMDLINNSKNNWQERDYLLRQSGEAGNGDQGLRSARSDLLINIPPGQGSNYV
jgi:hypothetical protein